jgi:predicted MFS family arabinose efflux permease
LLGWFRDFLGPKSRRVLPISCLLLFSVMLLVFGKCSTTSEFFLVAPFLGAAAFGYTPLLYVLVTEASGVKASGAASGLTNAVWQFGSTMSPLAVGMVFGHLHSFQLALGTLAIGPLVAALLLCLLRSHPEARPTP